VRVSAASTSDIHAVLAEGAKVRRPVRVLNYRAAEEGVIEIILVL
jgi:hypothetical protein